MKAVLKICGWLLLLLIAGGLALFLFLQTSHTAWLTQQVLSRVTSEDIHIGHSHYQYPNTLVLSDITIKQPNDTVARVNNLQITLDSHLDWAKPVSVTNVTLSGVNLPHGIPDSQEVNSWVKQWQPQHIEVRGIDFADHDLIARDLQLSYSPSNAFPEGYLNINGEQVYWKGEAFNHFKANLNYRKEHIQLDLLSFEWRKGKVQLIAEQDGDSWTLNDALVRDLHLSAPLTTQSGPSPVLSLIDKIHHIEHLTVEQSSWQQAQFAVNQMRLQLSNWDVNKSIWAQESELSFSAESVDWHKQLFLEPQLSAQLQAGHIQLEQLDFLFEEGQISTQGQVSPEKIALDNLSIKNLKWSIKDAQVHALIEQPLKQLQQLQINKLKIERSQVIDLATDKHWQISNLNAEGDNLSLKKDHQWALWNGSLAASANSLTLLGVTSINPYIEASSKDEQWNIKQLFLPIDDGLIKVHSNVNLALPSMPWDLSVQAYGIPLQTVTAPLNMAIHWNGVTDLTADLNGLGGDDLMFRHSLDGTMKIAPHDVQVQLPFATQGSQSLIIPEIKLTAQRGVLSVENTQFVSDHLAGNIQGRVDLVKPNDGNIMFNLTTDCVSFSSAQPKGRSHIAVTCTKPDNEDESNELTTTHSESH
ncbi:AsmA family protein [Vibrio neonatus]|uniref:AsmA family protein n=1 Tax=Vibrio neonatus TaxID=278860 RepID=UPI0021C312DF|nr:AsmA family protein [Vibrio neonatus]